MSKQIIPNPIETCNLFEEEKSYIPISYCTKFGGLIDGNYYPKININRCNKNDEIKLDIKCYTDEEILQKFGPYLYVFIHYPENYYIPNNATNPTKTEIEEKYVYIESFSHSYKSILTYSVASLVDDTGMIFEDEQPKFNFTQYDSFSMYDIGNLNANDNVMFSLGLRLTRTENSYHREYLKIPDALANAGGMMSLIMPIIEFLFSYYVDNLYSIFLYKNLFKLEIENDSHDSTNQYNNIDNTININKVNKDSKINKELNDLKFNNDISMDKKDSSRIEIVSIDENINENKAHSNKKISKLMQNFKLKETVINKDITKLINYKETSNEKVTIARCERFCFINCYCNSNGSGNKNGKDTKKENYNYNKSNLRYELINLSETKLEKYFDIVELFKVLNQFRLLKKLLLNENQCYLLENRELHTLVNSKRIWSNRGKSLNQESEDLKDNEIIDINDIKEKYRFEKLYEYLKIRKQENSFSNIDLVLLKYLDEDLKEKLNKS